MRQNLSEIDGKKMQNNSKIKFICDTREVGCVNKFNRIYVTQAE